MTSGKYDLLLDLLAQMTPEQRQTAAGGIITAQKAALAAAESAVENRREELDILAALLGDGDWESAQRAYEARVAAKRAARPKFAKKVTPQAEPPVALRPSVGAPAPAKKTPKQKLDDRAVWANIKKSKRLMNLAGSELDKPNPKRPDFDPLWPKGKPRFKSEF